MPRTARVWADLRAERVERLEQHGEDAKLPSSTRCEEPAKQTGYLRVEIKGDVCGGQAVRIAGTQGDQSLLLVPVQRDVGVLFAARWREKVRPQQSVITDSQCLLTTKCTSIAAPSPGT